MIKMPAPMDAGEWIRLAECLATMLAETGIPIRIEAELLASEQRCHKNMEKTNEDMPGDSGRARTMECDSVKPVWASKKTFPSVQYRLPQRAAFPATLG